MAPNNHTDHDSAARITQGVSAMTSQLALFSTIPDESDVKSRLQLSNDFKLTIAAYHFHRQGNCYQRHVSFFERSRATVQLHQLGGLLATW